MEGECQQKLVVKKLEEVYGGDAARLTKLLEYFSEQGSYREDLIFSFKLYLMLRCAAELSISNIQLGTCGQRIAAKLLSSVVKGRGINLCGEIADSEDFTLGEKTFYVCRPMKAHLNKEILSYLFARGILHYVLARKRQLCDYPPKMQCLPGQGNIDRLAEDFIDQIQAKFSSSVYTAINTSEKVVRKFNFESRCPMCLGHLDQVTNLLELKSYEDMHTSNPEQDQLLSVLCYGCKKIALNARYWKGSVQTLLQELPPHIFQEIQRQLQSKKQPEKSQSQQPPSVD